MDLDDPDYAAFAWRRFRTILAWMAVASVLAVGASLLALWVFTVELSLPVILATAGGVFCTVLLAAALFGLSFLSSGTGHDDKIEDPTRSGYE